MTVKVQEVNAIDMLSSELKVLFLSTAKEFPPQMLVVCATRWLWQIKSFQHHQTYSLP